MSQLLGDLVLGTDERCSVTLRHAPRPRLLVHHHVLPESWGGTGGTNLVTLCPTCHMNVHVLIDLFVKYGGEPARTPLSWFHPRVWQLARKAWAQRPPKPTPTL